MTIKKSVESFWKVFLSERKNLEKAIDTNDEKELNEIKRLLQAHLDEAAGCDFLIESNSPGFYELSFNPSSDKNAQYICALLKKLAPESIDDTWFVNSYLMPLSEKAYNTVIKIEDKDYTSDDFYVAYTIDNQTKTFDITLFFEGFAHIDENKRNAIANQMLELFIGELEIEARINHVDLSFSEPTGTNIVTLTNFYEVICDVVFDREWTEYHEPTNIYMAYKVNEELTSLEVRKDMKMVVTTHPLLFEELQNGVYEQFYEIFDKGGEYGFIYFEPVMKKEEVALFRQKLDKQINELLYPIGIAKTIGGAIGLKYAYIDLVVFDPDAIDKAIEKINSALNLNLKYLSFVEV